MKTYEQWSSRMKQLGKGEDQYSQAAYQGYVNNMKSKSSGGGSKSSGGGSNPRPLPVAQPPLQTNPSADLEKQIEQLHEAIESQNIQFQSDIAKAKAKKPSDASKAFNSTLLTGTAGVEEKKKKKQNYLQPIGG